MNEKDSVLKLVECAALGLIVEIVLKITHFVRDKTERMVQGEPLDVGLVFFEVFADGVELGENFFGFHTDLSIS